MMSAVIAWLRRLRPGLSRIGTRLLAFNLVAVFLPVAGILYLDVYEQQLLRAQERSMIQQARLVAAALGGHEALTSEDATALLARIDDRGDARVRVYDRTGRLVADTNRLPVTAAPLAKDEDSGESRRDIRGRFLYRVGASLAGVRHVLEQAARLVLSRPEPDAPVSPALEREGLPYEVRRALQGRYGAATRPTAGQRSLTLNSAVPVRSHGEVIGAVVVSQSTFRILQALYSVRLRVFEIVVASLAAAVVLSILLSTTIVRPLDRLRRAAAVLVDPPSLAAASLPGSERRDEIGDLARALEEVTRRLDAHVRLLESFAADVAHEFRNPLASIRTAGEMIAEASDEEDRRRFLGMLTRDVDRLERLVSGVRELARIDSQLAHEPLVDVDVRRLLVDFLDGFTLSRRSSVPVRLHLAEDQPALVRASPERLVHVFENVLVNACSFAPPGTEITVNARVSSGALVVEIGDRGPGIPPEHLERIFERFFTWRPGDPAGRREHAGLGLAIARAIVEGYGGTITAANRPEGGALITIALPLAGAALPLTPGAPALTPL